MICKDWFSNPTCEKTTNEIFICKSAVIPSTDCIRKTIEMKAIQLLIAVFFITQVQAQDTARFFKNADAFFKANVKNGLVNYGAVKNNPEALHALLDNASQLKVSTSDASTYQAFWINAYNLSVIKGIVTEYPVKQPLSIKGFFDKNTYNVGGLSITLNDIENKMLRAKFPSEPRFHFALVCAGLGCPPIINEAYTPSKLESQLQRQTEIAINNPNFIKVKENKVQVSQIFEWYKEDFVQNGNEIDFLNTYRKEAIPADAKLSYYPYDWTLNDTK